MHEHTYTADRLTTALARVKRELGKDAVILSSRRVEGQAGTGSFEVRAVAAADARGWREPAVSRSVQPARRVGNLLHRLLMKNGLDEGLAELLSVSETGEIRSLREASEALTDSLSKHVTFGVPEFSGPRNIMAFVGPTGVGKTTTLAKVAAQLALVKRRTVALITLDGYRIGATAQIEQFADLIGIPLEVARDAQSFARSLVRFEGAEVILVDTAGRAPRDKSAFIELAEVLHGTDETVEVSLCLAAASRQAELVQAAAQHSVLMPTSLTVTKVDEALHHDAIVTAHIASGLPLAWFTTGQRVPEDFEVAGPERLAAALCGEEVYA